MIGIQHQVPVIAHQANHAFGLADLLLAEMGDDLGAAATTIDVITLKREITRSPSAMLLNFSRSAPRCSSSRKRTQVLGAALDVANCIGWFYLLHCLALRRAYVQIFDDLILLPINLGGVLTRWSLLSR